MKHVTFIIVLCELCLKLSSQDVFRCSLSLPNSIQDISTCAEEVNSNCYVFGSSQPNTGSSSAFKFGVLKLNSFGDSLFSKSIGDSNFSYQLAPFGYTNQSLKMGSSVFVLNSSYNNSKGKGCVKILKYGGSSLDTIFTKYYPTNGNDTLNYYPVCIARKSSKDFVILSKCEANVAAIQKLSLITFDTTGTLMSNKLINNPFSSSAYVTPSSITYNNFDKSYFISGLVDGYGYSDHWGNSCPFIIRADTNGTIGWVRTNYSDKNRYQQNYSIVTTADSNQVFASASAVSYDSVYVSSPIAPFWNYTGGAKPSLTKINSNGDVIWKTVLSDTCRFCGDQSFISVIETSDKTLVAVGSHISGNNDSLNLIVAKFGSSGNLIWKNYYVFSLGQKPDEIWVNGLKQTSDSGFLISGGSFSKKFTALKLDKNGCLGSNCRTIWTGLPKFSDNEDRLILYPNPVTTNATLHFKSSQTFHTIMIYNCQGQRVFEKVSNAGFPNENSINLLGLKPGMFFLMLIDNQTRILGKKPFIVEP